MRPRGATHSAVRVFGRDRGGVDADVVRARRAAADADAFAATREGVVRSAACDAEIGRRARQLARGAAQPRTEHVQQSRANARRLGDAAVPQDRGWARRVRAQERGEVARDRRIVRVGQVELGERRTCATGRSVGGHAGEEAVEDERLGLRARELVVQRAADEPAAARGQGNRPARACAFGLCVVEQALLGDATGLGERRELSRLETAAIAHARFDAPRQREVHVVAAEQQVIADRVALERGLAVALAGDADQREVGRAAAEIADEHLVADRQVRAPIVEVIGEPRVERGLRLLEQRRREADLGRGPERELARDLVE